MRPNKNHQVGLYDAIIIGSGIGGLTAGAFLAQAGIKVLLLEKNPTPGGSFNSFKHRGYTFDGGIQGCENSGLLFPMLDRLGILNRIKLKQSKAAMAFPDFIQPIAGVADIGKFYATLAARFPQEEAAIKNFGAEVVSFARLLDAFFGAPNPLFQSPARLLTQNLPWLLQHSFTFKDLGKFIKLSLNCSIEDYVRIKFQDENLIKMILQMNYSGMPASLGMAFMSFFNDYFYPLGGVQAIPDLLAQYIMEQGGEIRYHTLVEKILWNGKQAIGVELKGGEELHATYIISNSDARRTYLRMLPPAAVPREFAARLKSAKVCESMFSVFLGVDIPPDKFATRDCELLFYFPDDKVSDLNCITTDRDYYRRSLIMFMIPSLIDPSLAPPGKSVVILQSLARQEFAEHWSTQNGKRNKAYRALKEEVADQLIANAEKIVPGLQDKIEIKLTATPFTYERYTLGSGGAAGGWNKGLKDTFDPGVKGMMGFLTPVKHLYLVGHWTMIPGCVPSGIMSGKIVSDIVKARHNLGSLF